MNRARASRIEYSEQPCIRVTTEKRLASLEGVEISHVFLVLVALTRCEMRFYTAVVSEGFERMRFLIKPWAVACLSLVTVTGVGVAIAQEGKVQGNANSAREISGGQDVNLTPAQMLERVRGHIPEMDKLRASVSEQLAEAKKKKDVVKALCLNDKVQQMKLATDTAKDRVVGLTSAASQNDPDRSRHEFTVIQVLRERVQTLVAEAQQCIGEETGFVGSTEVKVDVDPGLPDADPSDFPDDPLVSEPPVLSSPTL